MLNVNSSGGTARGMGLGKLKTSTMLSTPGIDQIPESWNRNPDSTVRPSVENSVGHPAADAVAKSLQLCPTLCDPIDGSPPGFPVPGILQASPSLGFTNTGVGCHFLLQGMNVKSESEVAQSCPTLSNPMDCSPPGSSVLTQNPEPLAGGLV